jgi:prepilin-type N-terminal cleavage/methylation domain-containing protein
MKNEGGFTLIEILAGIFILGIVLTVFFQFFIFSQKTTTDNKEQLVTLRIAESVLEEMISDKNIYRDKLSSGSHGFYYKEPYEEYWITLEVGAQQGDLGIYQVTVKVYRNEVTEKPLSEVKGLVEL